MVGILGKVLLMFGNMAIMLIFVCYIFQENTYNDMSYTLLLPTNTTLEKYLRLWIITCQETWIGGLCIYIHRCEVAAMTGRLSGFTTQIKRVPSEGESTFCVIRRETLASQNKCHLNLTFCMMWLFGQLCEMNTEHTHLFFYTQQWDGFLKLNH